MARPLRVNRAGGWYHVFARGLSAMGLFGDDRDREHLLELLEATVERYGVEVHAYALMDRHWYLAKLRLKPTSELDADGQTRVEG